MWSHPWWIIHHSGSHKIQMYALHFVLKPAQTLRLAALRASTHIKPWLWSSWIQYKNVTNSNWSFCAETLHISIYIWSQCPNFDRQLWMSLPTAVWVTHCRPDCISRTQQMRARESAREETMVSFSANPNGFPLLKFSAIFLAYLLTSYYMEAQDNVVAMHEN